MFWFILFIVMRAVGLETRISYAWMSAIRFAWSSLCWLTEKVFFCLFAVCWLTYHGLFYLHPRSIWWAMCNIPSFIWNYGVTRSYWWILPLLANAFRSTQAIIQDLVRMEFFSKFIPESERIATRILQFSHLTDMSVVDIISTFAQRTILITDAVYNQTLFSTMLVSWLGTALWILYFKEEILIAMLLCKDVYQWKPSKTRSGTHVPERSNDQHVLDEAQFKAQIKAFEDSKQILGNLALRFYLDASIFLLVRLRQILYDQMQTEVILPSDGVNMNDVRHMNLPKIIHVLARAFISSADVTDLLPMWKVWKHYLRSKSNITFTATVKHICEIKIPHIFATFGESFNVNTNNDEYKHLNDELCIYGRWLVNSLTDNDMDTINQNMKHYKNQINVWLSEHPDVYAQMAAKFAEFEEDENVERFPDSRTNLNDNAADNTADNQCVENKESKTEQTAQDQKENNVENRAAIVSDSHVIIGVCDKNFERKREDKLKNEPANQRAENHHDVESTIEPENKPVVQ
jgi:hypothetical protein